MAFTDTFTGSDNDLVSARTGWTAGAAGTDNAKINASNQVKFTDTANDSKVVTHDAGAADHYAQCVAKAGFAGDHFPLVVRCKDRDNLYGVRFTGGNWQIWQINGGAFSNPASAAGTVADGDTVKLEAIGTALTVYKNGSSVLVYDPMIVHLTETLTGMYPRSTATSDPVLDNWESTDPSGGASTLLAASVF